MSELWYVVQTNGGKEFLAAERLTSKGHLVFFPRCIVKDRPIALFTTYLFSCFDVDREYRSVVSTIGVNRVLGGEGSPMPVREGIVEKLILESNDKGITDISVAVEVIWKAAVGDNVMVSEGAFEGFIGKCVANTGTRVRLLLALLGGEFPVSFRHGEIEPAPLAALSGDEPGVAVASNRDARRHYLSVRGRYSR